MHTRNALPATNRKGRPASIAEPDPIDIYVGSRIKRQRIMLGYTQKDLSVKMKLSYQQIQKYESGINRIPVSRLIAFSSAFKVPVSSLLDELPLIVSANEIKSKGAKNRPLPGFMVNQEVLELAEAYYRITNQRLRRCIRELTKAISNDRRNSEKDE